MENNDVRLMFSEFVQKHLCGESLWFLDQVSGNQKYTYSLPEYEKNCHRKVKKTLK